MKRTLLALALFSIFNFQFSICSAQSSPDGDLTVNVKCEDGKPTYSVTYKGKECIMQSPLGLNTNIGDFTQGLTLDLSGEEIKMASDYVSYKLKRSYNKYEANAKNYIFAKNGKAVLVVTFQVSNNNVAFRYTLPPSARDAKCCVINSEATGFTMPDGTTTFMCPQMGEMTGFARTAPSYETHYDADQPMGRNGWGNGYTFPCLFKSSPLPTSPRGDVNVSNGKVKGQKASPRGGMEGAVWVLISETGVMGDYAGCKLQNVNGAQYKISFPSQKENNGYGTNTVQAPLPFSTPWRTITIADNLKPIVETTVTWDVLKQNMKDVQQQIALGDKQGSRGAWSWIIAGDASCNYDTQVKYIDFAAAMGWETLLIDAMWDTQIGRDRMAELSKYAQSKGVGLYLWYNSNGIWNDAPQGPRNCMDKAYERRKEMEWMHSIGIKGIKVDFFGGDKQCTMQLYHDILMDAADFDIRCIFHGCTLPRGWEVLYPNYVASEAVRASENLHFSQGECDREAMDATFMPFLRNAVGSMDFGGSTLNWYYNAGNNRGSKRVTSDVFALATAVLFQSPVQHFAMAPNNLTDAPSWALDFMKTVPTVWDDIRFIDGYPGKYVVLARKSHAGKWYLTAVNGQKEPLKLTLPLDMFNVGETVTVYSDSDKGITGPTPNGSVKQMKIAKKRTMAVTIPVNGAFLMNN